MGYTTDFEGAFGITPQLSENDRIFLTKLSESRRVKRRRTDAGIEGEFYVDGGPVPPHGDPDIVNYNEPPSTQPGLWCGWIPGATGEELIWDGTEKFYYYVEWLDYLIENYLAPKGYVLNGEMRWQGEDSDDMGKIVVKDNVVSVFNGKVVYEGEGE